MNRFRPSLNTPMMLLAALALALSACSPQARATLEPTLVPTIDLGEAYPEPQVFQPTAYPAAPTAEIAQGYPAGPLGVQVVENLSQITARLVELSPDASLPDTVRLRVEVLDSSPVEGFVEYTAGAVGQQIDLLAPALDLPALAPGDTLRAQVRYEGDERGGAYYASGIAHVTP